MQAVILNRPRELTIERVPDPAILEPTDAIVRVRATSICGSDLHLFNGRISSERPMMLGHELVGTIEDVGSAVTNVRRGDRVVVPFPIACGECWFCQHELPTSCEAARRERARTNPFGPAPCVDACGSFT